MRPDVQIDRPRFDRVIRKISYALFYHEFGFTWDKLLAVTTNQIKMPDMSNDHLGELFDQLSGDHELNGLVLKGSNPLVFQYSFVKFQDDKFAQALFMVFYEGFPFWVLPDLTSDKADLD